MLKRIVAFMTVCSIVGVLAIMQSSTPSHSSPLIILLVFLLLYVSVFGVLTFLLYGVRLAVMRIGKGKLNDRTNTLFSRSIAYGSVLAFLPIILVAVQSIGGLKLYEIILVVVFEAVAIFYVYKQR
ncbi:hypothetical protein HG436_000140 [Candidatus Saccharibacteria bacterium]|jgi:hypothetical protein|nr:hypothetical protein [Candidatus Saccharibacteria bacterium]